jgi:hypothetical protein
VFSEDAKTTDDESDKTDQKGCTAAAAVAPVTSAPPTGQQQQKPPKKPLAGRFQSAVGKMLTYMRPPKHSGDDDDSNGHRHATIQ